MGAAEGDGDRDRHDRPEDVTLRKWSGGGGEARRGLPRRRCWYEQLYGDAYEYEGSVVEGCVRCTMPS